MKNIVWVISLLLVLSALAGTALAQGESPRQVSDDEVNAVAKEMFCPVCENIPLDVCPTQACAEWRELIRLKLSEGWNEDQIKDYFVEQYGDRVLAEPPARGLNWLVYIIPPAAILLGVFILYRALRAWRSPLESAAGPAPAEPSGDPYINRLEEELKARK
jgi:cytochrome c-type biogenesis protein CcmH